MNEAANKRDERLSNDARDLSMIVALAGSSALGAILALSEAMRLKDGTFSLQFTVKTVVAFVIGFAVSFAYLSRILVHPEQSSRSFVRGGLLANIFLALAAFVYLLRFANGALAGRLEGLAAALCFIGGGFTLIRFVVHAAERQESEQETKERTDANEAAPRAESNRLQCSTKDNQPKGKSICQSSTNSSRRRI